MAIDPDRLAEELLVGTKALITKALAPIREEQTHLRKRLAAIEKKAGPLPRVRARARVD
jgi:hypothetical protein